MSDIITIGVIGLGNAGAPILNNLYNSKKYKLVAFDIDKNKLNDVSKDIAKANSIKDLLKKISSINSQKALKTINDFNKAVKEEVKYDPTIKDGRCTEGLALNKSNWANKIDKAPFYAYGVTCGITFTFGGLRVNQKCQVLNKVMKPIKGLFAAGEMVGGIFYFNYPGGSGLTSGAVFGKIAGKYSAKL